MTNPPRVEGVPDPRRSSDIQKKDEVDPQKFKRVMKVDASDEASKRHQRQRARQQEEEEEEEIAKTPEKPGAQFSSLLEERDNDDSLFGLRKGREQVFTSPSDENTLSSYTDRKTPVKKGEKLKESDSFFALQKKENVESKEGADHRVEKGEKKPKKPVKEKKAPPVQAEAPPPTTKAAKSPEGVIPTEETSEITKAKKAAQTATPKEQVEEVTSLPEEPLEDVESVSLAEAITSFEPLKEKELTPSSKKKKEGEFDEDHEKEKQKDKESVVSIQKDHKHEAPPPQPVKTEAIAAMEPTPITSVPSYAKLSSHVFELFERMVGLMILESKKGVHVTTIRLNMQGSVFHGCEIKLEQYSTAPNSFNVQLLGTPKAMDLFNANLNNLLLSFQEAKLPFQVHIMRPALLEGNRHLVRRKGKSTDDEPDQGKHK